MKNIWNYGSYECADEAVLLGEDLRSRIEEVNDVSIELMNS